MSMNIGTHEDEVMIDINTTPLIDVMLVLIIMLIITIPVQLHSVNLNMPAGNPPPPTNVVTLLTPFWRWMKSSMDAAVDSVLRMCVPAGRKTSTMNCGRVAGGKKL